MNPIFLSVIASAFVIFSSNLIADETYVCLYGNSERTIKVNYTSPDSKVPCEVIYKKETGSQVLWNAQNLEGYCESKAAEFVEKQRGWGWDCAIIEEVESTEPAPAPTVQ